MLCDNIQLNTVSFSSTTETVTKWPAIRTSSPAARISLRPFYQRIHFFDILFERSRCQGSAYTHWTERWVYVVGSNAIIDSEQWRGADDVKCCSVALLCSHFYLFSFWNADNVCAGTHFIKRKVGMRVCEARRRKICFWERNNENENRNHNKFCCAAPNLRATDSRIIQDRSQWHSCENGSHIDSSCPVIFHISFSIGLRWSQPKRFLPFCFSSFWNFSVAAATQLDYYINVVNCEIIAVFCLLITWPGCDACCR